MSIKLEPSKSYPGRTSLLHKHSDLSNMQTRLELTSEDVAELVQALTAAGHIKPEVEEFLPDNPGDSSPYFYYVTESETEARDGLHVGGKLMRRFVTQWEEVR